MIAITDAKFKIYNNYIVSHRCKLKVKDELEKLNIKYGMVDLRVVEIFKKHFFRNTGTAKDQFEKSGLE
jgi:hypothetical protein